MVVVWVVPLRGQAGKLYSPTMPKAETALDKPEEPFWPILVRLPRSRRPSSSRTSCWLYTCYRQRKNTGKKTEKRWNSINTLLQSLFLFNLFSLLKKWFLRMHKIIFLKLLWEKWWYIHFVRWSVTRLEVLEVLEHNTKKWTFCIWFKFFLYWNNTRSYTLSVFFSLIVSHFSKKRKCGLSSSVGI